MRAQALVAERLPSAQRLGLALAELVNYPEELLVAARAGLPGLADEAYRAEQQRVVPGPGQLFAVRQPLLNEVMRPMRAELSAISPSLALSLAERLAREPERELAYFTHLALERSLPTDPERSWQLMRRLGRAADDWLKVDSLAHLYARGIMRERIRWAEIEQLVFSASEWERRLVGATIAGLPFELPPDRRSELRDGPALALVQMLIGDDSETVRRSLSWALRSWREVDAAGVDRLLNDEARLAATTADGNRAWVIRDALKEARGAPPAQLARELRRTLAGIRRHSSGPTSEAAAIAGRFVGLDQLTEAAVRQQGERQHVPAGRA